eukprot:symbB.v1.2.011544.t1/scaffold778.1/size163404/27
MWRCQSGLTAIAGSALAKVRVTRPKNSLPQENLAQKIKANLPLEDLEPGADAEAASASFQGSDSWEASGDEGERIGDEGGESGDEGAGSGDEGEEIGDEIDGVPIEDFPHAHAVEEEQKASDSDRDSLTAPTMQLGEHTSDEETSEDPKG